MPESKALLLTAFLIESDQPCPQCGYNLRNLQGSRCPECGEDLELRVNPVSPKQKLLIAGLIGLSADAGWNGLLLIYIFVRSLGGRFGHEDFLVLKLCGLGFLVTTVLMIFWLRNWRRIRRFSTLIRFALVAACWIITAADLAAFMMLIK